MLVLRELIEHAAIWLENFIIICVFILQLLLLLRGC